MTTTPEYKPAEEIRPGDLIIHEGRPHVVQTIEPYTHPTLGRMVGIARCEQGWGMTLTPGARIEVGGF